MAHARVEEKTVYDPRKVKRVHLELTEGEADFLVAVMAKIGGHKTRSPRKYSDRVLGALSAAAGLDYLRTDAFPLLGGGIVFRDYPDPHAGKAFRLESSSGGGRNPVSYA